MEGQKERKVKACTPLAPSLTEHSLAVVFVILLEAIDPAL